MKLYQYSTYLKAYDTGSFFVVIVGVVLAAAADADDNNDDEGDDDNDDDDGDCGSISLYVYFIEKRVIIKGHDCT